MTIKHYILKGKKVVEQVDLSTWGKWLETHYNERIVKQETLKNGKWVSTVFLALDYNFAKGAPLTFETMVFPEQDNCCDLDMDRYSTYKEAEKGHKAMVKKWSKKT